jgi:DNA-binding MarR family transcriptional regulator
MTAPHPVPPESLCTCGAVRRAARQVTQLYDRHLAPAGLRITQHAILARLSRQGPVSINELARQMSMDRTSLGRTLQPLQREGLVALTPGADRRVRELALTEAGRARLKAAAPLWRAAQEAFATAYGAEATVALRATMGQVVAVLGMA